MGWMVEAVLRDIDFGQSKTKEGSPKTINCAFKKAFSKVLQKLQMTGIVHFSQQTKKNDLL